MAEINPNPWRPRKISPFNAPKGPPGFLREAATQWTLGPINQGMFRATEILGNNPDPNFNPWDHLKGYEQYAGSLVWARSRAEMDAMKTRIRFNERERDVQARGQWGLTAALFGSLFDPINLVPIPVSRGLGVLKGGAVGAASNAALAAATEPVRIMADPTADWSEMAYSVGGAALFGAALGGLSGALGRNDLVQGRANADRLPGALAEIEGANIARAFDAAEENYDVVIGSTGLLEDGRYEGVKIEVVEVPSRQKEGPDGNLYHYDDSYGWVLEADRGRTDPRPVAPEIVEGLGVPERITKNRMTVDEAGLKDDFEKGRHLETPEGMTPLTRDDIRTPKEYVTFRQIEAVWKRREPKLPGETDLQWRDRVRQGALGELKASRAAATPAGISGRLLDKLNLSPVSSALAVFKGDNLMGDLALQLGGDYGWAIRANEFGYKTPPSLLLRAMRHNVVKNELVQALDAGWLKYAQRNTEARGKMFMNQNVSAAAEAMKANVKALTGNKVMTRKIFSEMAGRAVYTKGDFTHEGFTVTPEMREVAQAWTRIAQRYDAEARELGLFYDETALRRTAQVAGTKVADLQDRMAKWLWGETGEPEKLTPAIRVKVTQSDFVHPDSGIYDGFHGSPRGFTQFSKDKLGENTNAVSAKMGFFFSKTPDTANTYSEAIKLKQDAVIPRAIEEIDADMNTLEEAFRKKAADVFLSDGRGLALEDLYEQNALGNFVPLQNRPYPDLQDRLEPDVKEFNENMTGLHAELFTAEDFVWQTNVPEGSSVHPVKLIMRNPYVWDERGQTYRERKYSEVISTAKSLGHDSVIIKNTYDPGAGLEPGQAPPLDDLLIVFDESQIVSRFDAPRVAEAEAMGNREVEQVFTGATHEEAMARLLDANPDFDVNTLSPDARGFVLRSTAEAAQPPADPKLQKFGAEGEYAYFMDGTEISAEEYANEMMAYTQEIDAYRAQQREVGQRSARTFRSSDQLVKDRIDSLSGEQRRLYDDWQDQIDRLARTRDEAEAQLAVLKEQPHRFTDQYGEPEPFFARFWNHTAIGMERERFKRLLVSWYSKDNPIGAIERADQTIDRMLSSDTVEDMADGQVPGLPHLMKRKLDMPNSYRIDDPELGEIRADEFFNTDLEAVGEAYIRGMGHKIEAARMFGDAGLWSKMEDMEDHWRERFYRKAVKRGASQSELKALRGKWDEYKGWIELIRGGVLGGLKTRDPWAWDNKWARRLKNYQILTSMGKILLTSIPEAMRVPMVTGFKVAWKSLWLRMFSDLDQVRKNAEFSRLSGELFETVLNIQNARVMEINQPDPGGGGRTIDRLMERAVPSFLKLAGLTHWTQGLKDLTMLASQHTVMDMARKLDQGDNAFRLAAMGISKRDARLLAAMPVEETPNGLILPAVQNWQGADGRRARTLLLDAIHGEARRAIVTPGFSDKNLAFYGVLARKGKKIGETDLMTLPLQFMSYGMAASQKVLMSGLQGRDQSLYMGALMMMTMGMMSNYLKQPQTATMNKSLDEWLLEGFEASGVAGFWFSDLNQMIERYSHQAVGLRPTLGIDPRFGKTTFVGDVFDAAGPSLGTIADVVMAFTDPERSATNRAQAIRRAVPYNNMIWWGAITRDIAGAAGRSFQE